MSDARTPTAEGLRRYPHSNGYNYELNPAGEPCTCDGCMGRCAGECGCQACLDQFIAFCEAEGFAGPNGMACENEARALEAYKAKRD